MLHKFSSLVFLWIIGWEKTFFSDSLVCLTQLTKTLHFKNVKNSGEALQALSFPFPSSHVIVKFTFLPFSSVPLKLYPKLSQVLLIVYWFINHQHSCPISLSFPSVFTFCSCQTELPDGHWRSGTSQAAPPSSWRGYRTGWCHYRKSSSSQILEGRSRPQPLGWCCWSGDTPPRKQKKTRKKKK